MSHPSLDNPLRIKLSDDRRAALSKLITEFFTENFDEELSEYRAERLLDFCIKQLGPPIYNQAIADARAFIFEKLDDLDVEFYEPE